MNLTQQLIISGQVMLPMNPTNKLSTGLCEFDPTVGNNWSNKAVHGSDEQAIHKSNGYSQS